MYTLKDMLHVKSIAVVGASNHSGKIGHTLLKNIIDGGFKGSIYPVNIKEDNILGYKCYKDILSIPEEIDLAVIAVPAVIVNNVIKEAGQKGAKGAIIISGGFKEIGNNDLEAEILETAEEFGMRIIGPNCQGVSYTANKMCATWPLIKEQGFIGIVSQSGTIGAALSTWAEKDEMGISCFASLGNKSDISETDFIEFFAEDPNTKVVALNLEGIQNGEVFVDVISRASQKKPIVVLKPGKTAKGMKAIASHTKSIAGNDRIFSAFCRKYGVIRANDITEFYDFCKIAGSSKKPKGNKMLIITSSGGAGIIATDTAEVNGIEIAPINEKLKKTLEDILPDQCVISNPLDLTGDATADRYDKALKAVIDDGSYDFLLTIFGDPILGANNAISKYKNDIPIIVSYLGGGEIEENEVKIMNKNNIPVFPTPERAVKAAKALLELKI
ncbi:MAG: CoA-binding protein [Lutispora sp.]|nr:CoA-binding protein [Lutispora sp.]